MDNVKTGSMTPNRFFLGVLIAVFALNQFIIGSVAQAFGMKSVMQSMVSLGIKTANAQTIVMPVLNEDGKTTTLKEMPTITELPGNPNSGDAVADAMTVMLGKGTTFYAPDGITFDNAEGALVSWGRYDMGIQLTPELEARYKRLILLFGCNFCCGSPMNVTVVGRCGCAHAKAARGFFKFMLNEYGDTYSDDQLVGEGYRWQAIWYPAGVVEDYLLATGRGDVIGHKAHGGVGVDAMHGLANN